MHGIAKKLILFHFLTEIIYSELVFRNNCVKEIIPEK
jgi:hypothetical protein